MASGIVIIDKSPGWTSMDVCAKIRGILKEKRVGHGGTLEPMATGVLPVCVGQATRAVEFAENGEKEYIAGLRLGVFHLAFILHLAALTRKIRRLNLGAVQIVADREIDGQILLRCAFIIESGGIHVPSDLISFLHRFYIAFDILNSV